MNKHCLAFLAVLAVFAGSANAAVIQSPVAATASSTNPATSIDDTINQSGLSIGFTSGVTDFDTYIASGPLHTLAFAGNEWFAEENVTPVTVTYDLGEVLRLDRLALWNEDASGFGNALLSASIDGIAYSAITTINPLDNPRDVDYPAEVFNLGVVDARFVRFELSACPQLATDTYTGCAMGEVAFSVVPNDNTVPLPGTLALLGLGMVVTGAWRRGRCA